MSLKKVSAATIIALSLAACSSGSDSPNSTLPNTNPTVTNSSNSDKPNKDDNAAGNNGTGNNGTGNNGNITGNNPPPRVDFLVSYKGWKDNTDKDVQDLAEEIGGEGTAGTMKSHKVTLGKRSSSGSNLDLSGYPIKELALNQDFQETATVNVKGNDYTATRSGKAHIYRQNYSLIAGINSTDTTVKGPGLDKSIKRTDIYILIKGEATKTLPTVGKFDYSGIASDGASKGKLAYSVDFDSRKGSGKITGMGSDINLNEASIQETSHTNEIDNTVIKGLGILGSSNRGDYKLGFFGPNAEEIVGTVDVSKSSKIGFAGSH